MERPSQARKFVISATAVGVLLAGVWGATLLLPPTGPVDEAEALHEISVLYARIDSTLPPQNVQERDDLKTSTACPRDGHGFQTTLERSYHLNQGFVPDRWLDELEAEFPAGEDWYIKISGIGDSEGRQMGHRVRLAGPSLLAIEMTLVGEGSDQWLRMSASSRCYPATPPT